MKLDADVEAVYAFHGNPHNISDIAPGWQRVTVTQAQSEARAGEEFEIVVRFFGLLPMRWHGVWREARRPTLLVDEAISGPFAYWRHEHHFEPLEGGCTRMTDHVFYSFPGGRLGKWFGETLGRVQFHFMFADRHARTRRRMREPF